MEENETVVDEAAKPKRGRPRKVVDQAAEVEAETLPAVNVTRRKVSRGSTRRIMREVEAVEKALAAFSKELDLQVYLTDADGNRVGQHPLVGDIAAFRQHVAAKIAEITSQA